MRMLDFFLPGGGSVFNQEHNILPDVPPQNIVATYQAVRDYGGNGKGDLLWNERREVPA
jgi:uroporphyrinogen-III decarboxylase